MVSSQRRRIVADVSTRQLPDGASLSADAEPRESVCEKSCELLSRPCVRLRNEHCIVTLSQSVRSRRPQPIVLVTMTRVTSKYRRRQVPVERKLAPVRSRVDTRWPSLQRTMWMDVVVTLRRSVTSETSERSLCQFVWRSSSSSSAECGSASSEIHCCFERFSRK